jgi:hypothetical protein
MSKQDLSKNVQKTEHDFIKEKTETVCAILTAVDSRTEVEQNDDGDLPMIYIYNREYNDLLKKAFKNERLSIIYNNKTFPVRFDKTSGLFYVNKIKDRRLIVPLFKPNRPRMMPLSPAYDEAIKKMADAQSINKK